MNARKSMFAGSWYPAGAAACEREIEEFLAEGKAWQVPERSYAGGIVPHAGWFYSGAVACNVIHKLVETPAPDVFLVFGMHLPSGAQNYIMKAGRWETPFGELPIELRIAEALTQEFAFKIETEKQFTPDNTIELQLPFIKYFFKDIAIVPMGVPPDLASLEIGKRAVAIAQNLGLKVKVIGSTDLTHYGVNYGFMPKGTGKAAVEWVRNENDRKVIDAMTSLSPEKVLETAFDHHNACCAGAAATAISAARALGAAGPAELVTYTTSYDKSPGDSLVGYVGMVF
jgi:MEMO1 family protein